jgi:hypothetical protein
MGWNQRSLEGFHSHLSQSHASVNQQEQALTTTATVPRVPVGGITSPEYTGLSVQFKSQAQATPLRRSQERNIPQVQTPQQDEAQATSMAAQRAKDYQPTK